jgi:hypothetical protein
LALESCPVCGHALSIAEHRCLHCGHLRPAVADRTSMQKHMATVIMLVVVLLVVLAYFVFFH